MKTLKICVAAILCTSASIVGCAAEYDDPAVAICEAVVKMTIDAPTDSFKRISAEISGAKVRLSYQNPHLNIKPKTQEALCKFVFNDGSFTLDPPLPRLAKACEARLKYLHNLAQKKPLSTQTVEDINEMLEKCKKVIFSSRFDQIEMILALETMFSPMGIYPILAADTALTPD